MLTLVLRLLGVIGLSVAAMGVVTGISQGADGGDVISPSWAGTVIGGRF